MIELKHKLASPKTWLTILIFSMFVLMLGLSVLNWTKRRTSMSQIIDEEVDHIQFPSVTFCKMYTASDDELFKMAFTDKNMR